jgi:mono/diheme cytochrome c family protein
MLAINPTVLAMRPDALHNPIPLTAATAKQGRKNYVYYCIQCHGPDADGYGTVGQSFNPLPTNLASSAVQSQSDGELYFKINLGYRAHPPLGSTLSPDAAWAVINYIRSLQQQATKRD